MSVRLQSLIPLKCLFNEKSQRRTQFKNLITAACVLVILLCACINAIINPQLSTSQALMTISDEEKGFEKLNLIFP